MQPTIFAFGIPLPSIDRFTVLSMEANDSWLDADVILVEPHLGSFETSGSKGNVPSMSPSSSIVYTTFRDRWDQQFKIALEHGKLVVVLLPPFESRNYYIHGGGTRTSLTSNYRLSGLMYREIEHVKGKQMALTSHASFLGEYWKMIGPHSQFQSLFAVADSVPLVTTKTGNQMCGCWMPQAGKLMALPYINWRGIDFGSDENKGKVNFAMQLRQALTSIYKNLSPREPVMEVPEWVKGEDYFVGREPAILAELTTNRAESARLAVAHEELEKELAAEQALKALLFGSGKPLEEAVRRALTLIGFETTNYVSEGSEFDVVFTSDEGRFIGEVEGKDNRAIAVDKASQLHRNIAEDFSRDEIDEMAQGVLFGNAFRMKSIAERAEVFTDKVVTFSGTANISLVRTADLFAAVQHYLKTSDEGFAKSCREAIASSKGRIVEFPQPDSG